MIRFCVFGFFLFSLLWLLVSSAECPTSFLCKKIGPIEFPFTTAERPDCGVLAIRGCDGPKPTANKTIRLNNTGGGVEPFEVLHTYPSRIVVRDKNLHDYLKSQSCEAFKNNISLPPSSPLASFKIENSVTFFRCNSTLNISLPQEFIKYKNCSPDYNIFYSHSNTDNPKCSGYPRSLAACATVQLPVSDQTDSNNPFTFLTAEFTIHALSDCEECHNRKRRGKCRLDGGKIQCFEGDKTWIWKVGLGLSTLGLIIGLLFAWHYKRKLASSKLILQTRNTDNNWNPEQQISSTVNFGVPVFSYRELLETTNNFDADRKLGDGGFSTVYYGKLQDGREVAIKRLYDHNYRQIQQFINEIEILTCLRHKNLVSLFGCTSPHSHELLLVYEYIPNGTIASHLHGHLAHLNLLSWPIRMKIAIEIASALVYLHASDIIHRDVKTNNILLDNNFCVKVADFGLSRLFPNDVTHISTAPQGTPGYVDPEYHLCHQLTSKSDVYSFGVVLVELISSMPPVNMTRHKDEINLANLAMKKIRNNAISELIDPSLGFHSNNDVKRTMTSVVELAFQCLQWENELRPSMDKVLEVLMGIESGKDELGDLTQAYVHKEGINSCNFNVMPPPNSLDCNEVGPFKDVKSMPSPTTVTDNWASECTTSNISG